MAEHTPGPWHVEMGAYVLDSARTRIADVCDRYDGVNNNFKSSAEANAKLIAAAPDLLEALQRLVDLNCPLTGNPSHEELVEHWNYEKTQGRGEADDQLFALMTLAKAKGLK